MVLTLLGTGFTFLCTTIGAAAVFFTKNDAEGSRMETMSLGFAAGIMTAAAVWSLLIPAGDAAQDQGLTPWIVTTVGFIFGALFLKLLDSALPHLHPRERHARGPEDEPAPHAAPLSRDHAPQPPRRRLRGAFRRARGVVGEPRRALLGPGARDRHRFAEHSRRRRRLDSDGLPGALPLEGVSSSGRSRASSNRSAASSSSWGCPTSWASCPGCSPSPRAR